MTLIKNLIDIPDHVEKGQFVLRLAEGVTRPEETLHDNVVTPKLKACNEDAIGFIGSDFWRLRGKLDMPKERSVTFPYCEGEDGTLTVAWAGAGDHLPLARSISACHVDVQERLCGRDDRRLVPLRR